MLAARPDNLSMISRIHTVQGEKLFLHTYKHRHAKDIDGTHIGDPPFRSHSQARRKTHIAYVSNSCPACLFMPMGWKEPPGRERFCGPSPTPGILKPWDCSHQPILSQGSVSNPLLSSLFSRLALPSLWSVCPVPPLNRAA